MVSREDKTIEQFCGQLSKIEQQEVRVVARPDRDNPGQGGCDAIIKRGKQLFAVEHTTIDSFKGQRADDARFNQMVVPLEKEILSLYPDSHIEISIPINAFSVGTNWPELTKIFKNRCFETIAKMPFSERLIKFTFNDLPFSVWISRLKDYHNPVCYVARIPPGAEELSIDLECNICHAIRKKREQLKPYKERRLSTLLLLDSDDVAFFNKDSFADVFCKAAAREDTEGIDEVFIVEADRNPIWSYPVKLYDRMYPYLPEFGQFFVLQYKINIGQKFSLFG